MGGNSFGTWFRITTFGESHGPAIGVVLDGVLPGLQLDLARVQAELARRAPGGALRSPRQEPDEPEVVSGLLDGVATGAPLAALIRNRQARPADYDRLKDVLRPGHAGFSWLARFGIYDHRGGGRASGRETAARVFAGAVARQQLEAMLPGTRLQVRAFVDGVGPVRLPELSEDELLGRLGRFHPDRWPGPVPCPDADAAQAMEQALVAAQQANDSLGGTVRCLTTGLPAGLGEPVFDKLPALLGHALLSLGGVRGFEIGAGFGAARLRGSAHNDTFTAGPDGHPRPASNRAGGVLGGVTTGLPLDFRLAVKPTSSIGRPQQTVDVQGRPVELAGAGRHDPCIALRLPPVVEAMTCLVLLDLLLARRAAGRPGEQGG